MGGSDFALSLGFPLNRSSTPPELVRIVREVQEYALSRGKVCAAMARTAEAAAALVERGVLMVALGVDQWTLHDTIKSEVTAALSQIQGS